MDGFKYVSGILLVLFIVAIVVWKQEYDLRVQYQEKTIEQADSIRALKELFKGIEKDTVKTDTLRTEKLYWVYPAQKISYVEQVSDVDATWLLPQSRECLEAYKWLREKRRYSARRSIELTVKWWEKRSN